MRTSICGLFAAVLLSSCDSLHAGMSRYELVEWWNEAGLDIPVDRETGKPLLDEARALQRSGATGFEAAGPKIAGLSASTEVWAAPRRWYEISAEAGIAWPANSGWTWDQKFAAWVDSLETTASEEGWTTVEIRTPWGRELPSPRLECAELGMFLRAAFASWYGLPFTMTAWHPDVGNLHFGHFGVVNDDGVRITGYPTYAVTYTDHTGAMAGKSAADVLASWPSDATLAARKLTSLADDHNGWLGENAYAGAYFDQMFLNKRAGYFMLSLLTNMGSMHLASDVNTFNLAPTAIREGDVSVQRWQAQGIGHVVVLKEVDWVSEMLQPEVVYGSMPRIQPKWYDETISRTYLTSPSAGGAQTDASGTPYSRFGGGLKRWRTPVQKNGRWMNIVPVKDRESFIVANDYARIEGRLTELEALMGTLTPEEEKAAILERIEVAREALRSKPASCSNRTRREDAFDDLYTLMETAFGQDRAAVDAEYRQLEDYVLAELTYDQSKTCCWNSTTSAMFDIVMDYAEQEQEQDACVEPTVFRAEQGGYDRWKDYAAATNRAAAWVAWSEDEACPQRTVRDDAIAASEAVHWCALPTQAGGSESGCNGVTWEGYCDGPTVTWCQDDAIETYTCPAHLTCGWDEAAAYYWCL